MEKLRKLRLERNPVAGCLTKLRVCLNTKLASAPAAFVQPMSEVSERIRSATGEADVEMEIKQTDSSAFSDEDTFNEADTLLTAGSRASQIKNLTRALTMQRASGLYFVCVSKGEHEQVLDSLRAGLREFVLVNIRLNQPIRHPLRHLVEAVSEYLGIADVTTRALICVYGLETWLQDVEAVEQSDFVASLNMTRNAFASVLGCPLVFCVPNHILVGIMRGAPDFFSVRNGLYFLDEPPVVTDASPETLMA